MRPYHPANLKWQPFPHWRVIALAWVGKLLGIQFKINGMPFGASYNKELWRRHEDAVWGIREGDGGRASEVLS